MVCQCGGIYLPSQGPGIASNYMYLNFCKDIDYLQMYIYNYIKLTIYSIQQQCMFVDLDFYMYMYSITKVWGYCQE